MRNEMPKLSHHITNDRAARYLYLATKIGFGDTVDVLPYLYDSDGSYVNRKLWIKETGIVMILNAKEDLVVTMYLMETNQLTAFYAQAGKVPPQKLYAKVQQNERRGYIKKQNMMTMEDF